MSSATKIVLATVLAMLLCLSLPTESASVHHQQHHHQSHHRHHANNSQRLVRSSDKAAQDGAVNHCSENTPCGWAVYTRFTRVVDYFMKNTCTCSSGLECIRVDDDVSVSAFVYKCRHVPSNSKKATS